MQAKHKTNTNIHHDVDVNKGQWDRQASVLAPQPLRRPRNLIVSIKI